MKLLRLKKATKNMIFLISTLVLSSTKWGSACSDPGWTLTLPAMKILLFPTQGSLSETSMGHIEEGTNNFLYAELTQYYSTSPSVLLDAVDAHVMTPARSRRLLQEKRLLRRNAQSTAPLKKRHPDAISATANKMEKFLQKGNIPIFGSELDIVVDVLVNCTSSTIPSNMNEAVLAITQELKYFVTNITEFGDPALSSIQVAILQDFELSPTQTATSQPTVVNSQHPSTSPSPSESFSHPPSNEPSLSQTPSTTSTAKPSIWVLQVPSTSPSMAI